MTLIITHTEAEGTLLAGTSRGDASAEIAKALGWRWGRSLGAWYVPRSRDQLPKRKLISSTVERLERAGFVVTVTIDSAAGDRAAAEERRADRAAARSQRLAGRAEREQDLSDARETAAKLITDHIPLGQPLLVDHHSYARDLRRREKAARHFEASVEHQRNANRAAAAATVAGEAMKYRNSPVTVANRIERLGAEIRRDERVLARLTGQESYALDVQERLAVARADLAYWQSVREQQITDGIATNYGPDTVKPGDLVKYGTTWYPVVRANKKTVSVDTGRSWANKLEWPKIADHRPAGTPAEEASG